ncbi:hypothetical protein L211DRAFT_870938 [Terfezia boudieri ATCC MYA-4762]|uniref:Peptidase A2 domain-containing protein n=1 Tax=Terfezia boudieri ATCC MYA-4762 TaxID=1051890 RepID=A0A3N4LER3_9PEZI|nr:hypothetical protein L211DRAFT_870938 [Terfezia boudieri ATCC MYA-4762]
MEDTIRVQLPRRANMAPRRVNVAAKEEEEQEWSPAFLVGAFFGKTFNQDVLLDCGATCSLVSPELSTKILRENTGYTVIKPEREMSVTGIGGKSTVEGWVKIVIDLGKGVVAEHTLLICRVGGGYEVLLGKPFLAMIDAKVGMRHDYIEVPRMNGPPILLEGRRYVGGRKWMFSETAKSEKCLIYTTTDYNPYTVKHLKVTPRVLARALAIWVEVEDQPVNSYRRADEGVELRADEGVELRADEGVELRADEGVELRADEGVESGNRSALEERMKKAISQYFARVGKLTKSRKAGAWAGNLVLPMEVGRYEDKMVFLRNEKLDEIRHLATERQLKAWEHRVEQYQAKLRDHEYLVGDLVLFQNYAKRHKPGSPWEDRWKGPARITYITSKGKIDFQTTNGTIHKGWHTDRVKPFILRELAA